MITSGRIAGEEHFEGRKGCHLAYRNAVCIAEGASVGFAEGEARVAPKSGATGEQEYPEEPTVGEQGAGGAQLSMQQRENLKFPESII